MTFAASETSLAAGTPYELHEFRLGATSTYWRYADAPVDIVYGGNTFVKCYIKGGRIEQGTTALKQRTTVKCDWLNPFAWGYTAYAPEEPIHYTRYKGHGSDVSPIFLGDVVDVIFRQSDRQGTRWAEIPIDPLTAVQQRAGLVSLYSRQCHASIYDARCDLVRAAYQVSGTLDSVTGNTLTSTTFGTLADGRWKGGDIVINGRRRAILSHTGNDIVIWPPPPGLAAGQSFDVCPGCDHLWGTCSGTYSNGDNYPGQPDIPDEDPSSPWGIL